MSNMFETVAVGIYDADTDTLTIDRGAIDALARVAAAEIKLQRNGRGVYRHEGRHGTYHAERMDWADANEWLLTYPDGDASVAVSLEECRRWISDSEASS